MKNFFIINKVAGTKQGEQIVKEQVEKHYINYVLDLLLYISEQLKK